VTWAMSPTTLRRPPDQNHHFTLSFIAHMRLGLFLPVFSLHSFSFSALFPRIDHQIPLIPGPISPRSRRSLYSFAVTARRSKDSFIFCAMCCAPLSGCNFQRSVASRGRSYPNLSNGVIQSKVIRLKMLAEASGIRRASSRDAGGEGGIFERVKGTRVHLEIVKYLIKHRVLHIPVMLNLFRYIFWVHTGSVLIHNLYNPSQVTFARCRNGYVSRSLSVWTSAKSKKHVLYKSGSSEIIRVGS